jgi:site-specific recombinase XerD
MPSASLRIAVDNYLHHVAANASENTHRTYAQAIRKFLDTLKKHKVDRDKALTTDVSTDWVAWYVTALKPLAPATEALFLTALIGFYEYLASEEKAPIDLVQVRSMLKRRQRKPTPRLPQFPREEVESVISYVNSIATAAGGDDKERLRQLRDRAFILTLCDTGLRISEACRLNRGHLDWAEGRAIVIIKGGRESLVRFSERALSATKTYLNARAEWDGASGRSLASLPIFARHDDGAGKKVLRLNTVGARQIVNKAVVGALGESAKGTITPHSFRHYFVTIVLRASGGNLKLAQELARHKNIAITQRYAHLSDDDLDRNYHEIFNEK